MNENITSNSSENIVELSAIRREKHRVLSPYGPVKADLTTYQGQEINRESLEVQLMELLNSLESAVENLQYKSFTDYDTLMCAIEGVRVALSPSTENTGGTNV